MKDIGRDELGYRPRWPPSPPSPLSRSPTKVARASGPSAPVEASSRRATGMAHPLDLGLYLATVQSLSDGAALHPATPKEDGAG